MSIADRPEVHPATASQFPAHNLNLVDLMLDRLATPETTPTSGEIKIAGKVVPFPSEKVSPPTLRPKHIPLDVRILPVIRIKHGEKEG